MSVLRVARIPYLNSAPFYRHLSGAGCELLDLPPRQLGAAARRGRVDAGILSMCDGFRSPEFVALGAMGVAVDGPAQSVLLFSHRPPAELDGAKIAVTSETSTSYPLLRILLDRHFGVTPAAFARRTGGLEPDDAGVLLIGDRALVAAAAVGLRPGAPEYQSGLIHLDPPRGRQAWSWVTDLAMVWKQWQGLPFVFARWMVRQGVDPSRRDRLLSQLSTGLDASLRELEVVAATEGPRAGLDAESAYAYLMGFTYRLGTRELEAIERFRTMLADSQWWNLGGGEAVETRRPA